MTDTQAPLYGYNSQYFRLNPKYTKEELYGLQDEILVIISEGSNNVEKDLNTKIDRSIIHGMLMQFWRRELVKKERLGIEIINDQRIPINRYFT